LQISLFVSGLLISVLIFPIPILGLVYITGHYGSRLSYIQPLRIYFRLGFSFLRRTKQLVCFASILVCHIYFRLLNSLGLSQLFSCEQGHG
jgi:hypothetical protein